MLGNCFVNGVHTVNQILRVTGTTELSNDLTVSGTITGMSHIYTKTELDNIESSLMDAISGISNQWTTLDLTQDQNNDPAINIVNNSATGGSIIKMRSTFSNVGTFITMFKQGSGAHWNFGMAEGTSHAFNITRTWATDGEGNSVFTLQYNGLTITGYVAASSFTNTSDDKLKGNQELIENACETLCKLKLQTYD